MTNTATDYRPRPNWGGPVAPIVAWAGALLSLTAVGFALSGYSAGTWLSFPLGLLGAVAGGNARRFLPMILCIIAASVLPLAILLAGF